MGPPCSRPSRSRVQATPPFPAAWESLLVGESSEMRQVVHIIRMVGPRRATVLITGETGSEKRSPLARCTWRDRAGALVVAVNCTALPENLLESELFGHVRGAFTGAVQNRVGRFEQAHGGTLFLDEIGDLPMELQAKLLRVLQEREFQRLGSSETVRVDVRVVAATNCDLERANRARAGSARTCYYRLNVVPLQMPPLRRRRDDIPLLARHFVEKVCRAEGIPLKSLSREPLERLAAYSWPGNVRQLENAIEMAVALSGDRAVLDASRLPARRRRRDVADGRRRAGGRGARRRHGLRADAGRRSNAASWTGAAKDGRQQEGRGGDAGPQAHDALRQGTKPAIRPGVQLMPALTTDSLWRSRACRSRPARARRGSSSATPARAGRSGCT